MTTLSISRINRDVFGIITAAALGLGLLFAAGVSQASAAHNAAHDTRHAMSFPCH